MQPGRVALPCSRCRGQAAPTHSTVSGRFLDLSEAEAWGEGVQGVLLQGLRHVTLHKLSFSAGFVKCSSEPLKEGRGDRVCSKQQKAATLGDEKS